MTWYRPLGFYFRLALLFFLTLATGTIKGEVSNYEKLELTVGAKRSLLVPKARRISVSRRGVIHFLEASEERFMITGLRSGLCVVDILLKGGTHKLFYVEVHPKPTANSKTESIDVTNVQSAEQSLYQAVVDIDLLETSKAETRGGDGHLKTWFMFQEPAIARFDLKSKLESRDTAAERTVLAHPTFHITEGVQAILKSGGEQLHVQETEKGDSRSVWHEFGMTLNLTVNRALHDQLRSDVLFILKTPGGSSHQFSLNQIQTSALMKPREMKLLGTIDLSTSGKENSDDFFMSKIPIIGPLFSQRKSDRTAAMVRLWLKLSPLN
jgi:hypothetical protein